MSVLATGSGLARFVYCRASSVLPRIWRAADEFATGGRERHAYLERISNGMSPEESLELVAEEHRDGCAEIPLDKLARDLRLASEVTLVYRPADNSARILGYSLDRDYRGVEDDEVPMTLDLVGVNKERRRGTVKDYKSGWQPVTAARENWQILGGALALARIYDLDEVEGELIFVRPGQDPHRDSATFKSLDLLAATIELREAHARAQRDREAYARGEHVEPSEGPHCTYCPCAWACPAKVGLIRAALGGDLRSSVVPAEAARLRPRIREAIKLLKAADAQIVARAIAEPIHVETNADGTETVLGEVVGEGNEKLDAKIVLPIAAEVLNVPPDEAGKFIEELADLEVTKTSLEKVIAARVPRGQGAATKRRILAKAKEAGGVTRPVTRTVELYTRPSAGER